MTDGLRDASQHGLVEARSWTRSVPVKSMFRPHEHADLQVIAKAWGVPVATTVWAIVADQLSRWRRRAPELGEAGLSIAAAMTVLRQKGNEDSSGPAAQDPVDDE